MRNLRATWWEVEGKLYVNWMLRGYCTIDLQHIHSWVLCSDRSLFTCVWLSYTATRDVIIVYLFITLPQPITKSRKSSYRWINTSVKFNNFLIWNCSFTISYFKSKHASCTHVIFLFPTVKSRGVWSDIKYIKL